MYFSFPTWHAACFYLRLRKELYEKNIYHDDAVDLIEDEENLDYDTTPSNGENRLDFEIAYTDDNSVNGLITGTLLWNFN